MKNTIESCEGNKSEVQIVNVEKHYDISVRSAKEIFLKGGIFIYPTDTIYGFGGNPFNEEVVNRITKIKGRSSSKRYLLLVGDISTLKKYVDIKSERHYDFLLSIWPNPISVVLKLNKATSKLLDSETAAFRVPHHRFCNKLLDALKMPIISTSVNRSKKSPLTEFSLIKEEFSSEVDAIFYTGKKSFITASTIIDLTKEEPVLLRDGKINFEKIMQKF